MRSTPPLRVSSASSSGSSAIRYPATRVEGARELLFGNVVEDPYRWLEDATSPEVVRWISQQDELTRTTLSVLPERASIAARMRELLSVERVEGLQKRGNRYFWWKQEPKQEKRAFWWKDGRNGTERLLLDPNAWSADGSLALVDVFVSWDGRYVAYNTSKNNSDETTLRIVDVSSGKSSEVDTVEGTQYAPISWNAKSDGVYYRFTPTTSTVPPSERMGLGEVRFHKLGDSPKNDRVVHPRTGDSRAFLSGSATQNGHWLLAEIWHGWSFNEVYYQDLRKARGWLPLAVGTNAQYEVAEYRDRFYVKTNEGAPRGRVFAVDPTRPARAAWKEIVPERADATLESLAVIGEKMVLGYLKDATSHVEIHDAEGKLVHEVRLPGLGYATVSGHSEDATAYVQFASFTHPPEIFELSVVTGEMQSWYRSKVPVDSERFVVRQVWYSSKDGTRVPMFLVHAKGLNQDGNAPAYLYGYGGFQKSVTPLFEASVFPWLERGGVFAVPSLRGGGEFGEPWHRAGMLHNKQNVFDDFYAAAEYLVREGYTRPEKIMAHGGSNGGLLVGAGITQRPDLFRVAVCEVPILDMLRFDLSAVGQTAVDEYGSPKKADDFPALFAYSPYHHVVMGKKYPAVLVLSADSDDRVDPMHARKFVAMLQARSTGGPVLLRVERNSGHLGADLMRAAIERTAEMEAFALSEMVRPAQSTR
ncbi:prolyl oligopeptidase family protein [Pendulispora albinea]|uniref:prolyl oligopeptidase n=1 Tax=Pendulispora albinea TaxID=2741071 RepID=A0ABZ2MCP3_9BACT